MAISHIVLRNFGVLVFWFFLFFLVFLFLLFFSFSCGTTPDSKEMGRFWDST